MIVFLLLAGFGSAVHAQDPAEQDRQAMLLDLQRRHRMLTVRVETILAQKQAAEVNSMETRSRIETLRAANEEYALQHDRVGISAASFEEVLRSLQTQRVQLSIDLAGLEARREAMIEQQEQWSGQDDPARSTIQAALADLLAAQNENVRRIQALHEKGHVSESDLQGANEKLLEAKIRVAQAAQAPQDERRQQVENELLQLSLSRAESSARLSKIQELLDEFTRARMSLEAYRQGLDELRALEVVAEQLQQKQLELESQLVAFQIELQQIESEMELYRLEKRPSADKADSGG
jgi:hypothetical protein